MSVKRLWTTAMLVVAVLVAPRDALPQVVTASWTSATAQDATAQIGIGAPGDVVMSFNVTGGTITAGSLNFEISDDGATWYGATCSRYSVGVLESGYSLNLAPNQVWSCPVGGPMSFRVRLNPVITGAGTANLRMNVAGISRSSGVASLGNAIGKTNQLKTGNLVTTTATADQVVLTYTVTANKTLYLEYLELEGRLTAVSATATILGDVSLETPSTTKVITTTMVNPTTSAPDKVVIPFGEPIPISSGTVIRVVVTPTAVTSMTWKASFGGYEK